MQVRTTARLRAGALAFAVLASASGCDDQAGTASDAAVHDGGGDGDRDGGLGDGDIDGGGPGSDGGYASDAQMPKDGGDQSQPDAGAGDAGADAMDASSEDASSGSEDAATDANHADEGDAGEADAATGDTEPACDVASCLYGVCTGAACAVERVAKNISDARDMTLLEGRVYWVNNGLVYGCTTDPCANGGTLVWDAGTGHTFLSVVGQRVNGTDYLFVADNQYGKGVVRVLVPDPGDSGAQSVPNPPASNASPIAAHGSTVVWSTRSNTYRTDAITLQTTTVLNTGWQETYPTMGTARSNVAVNADYLFAADWQDVYKCPITDTCTTNPSTAATTPMPKVVSLTIYDGTLYALGGEPLSTSGSEKIWSVPVTGGASSLHMEMTPEKTNTLHAYTLLADEASLYWNSYDGNIYYCARVGTCEPTVLVPASKAVALAQDDEYLYWLNRSARTIDRIKKP